MIKRITAAGHNCEYEDTEYEECVTHLRYIGNGKNIRLPKGYTSCEHMFTNCKLETLDFSNFDTSEVTDMVYMFSSCNVSRLDLSNFNTDNVKNMWHMFNNCTCDYLDMSSFNTEKVTSMYSMFKNFKISSKTLDLSNFNIGLVRDTDEMFEDCNCEYLDISTLVKDKNMPFSDVNRKAENMYLNCPAIFNVGSGTRVLGVSNEAEANLILGKYRLLGLEEPTIYRKIR